MRVSGESRLRVLQPLSLRHALHLTERHDAAADVVQELNQNTVTRETKRLELQVARLAAELRRDER